MAYHHLTEIERYHIQWYLENNFSLRKIALALGRNVSTISREIAHCLAAGFKCYIADYQSKIEAVINRKTYKLKGNLLKTVKYLLKKKFSPEQISAYLFSRKGIKISHTAIKTYFITKPKTRRFIVVSEQNYAVLLRLAVLFILSAARRLAYFCS